jgi:hypothetical protein
MESVHLPVAGWGRRTFCIHEAPCDVTKWKILLSPIQYTLGIIAALATLGIVIEMLRRRHLRERHAGWWIIAGIFAIVISVFPSILEIFSQALGFEVPVNLVFFVSLFTLFLVALQHSSELTQLESHNRAIVERLVVVELRLEKLQENYPFDTGSDSETLPIVRED